ncbi:Transcriptional activator of proteases prtT [Penicillium subrubescens]|uniref:Transcriptional activator of proteases prtT n=1 Tax=Penicillium subrubescens TaxID=1316194 RepID=A0A1Q5UH11_9EURO|nr:Transcriptional activator of proteases prtT [Penicillium subrubescens]
MTRTEPTNSTTSWETKSIAALDDGHRIDSVGQDPRPRGRIRRSMTACNTCRKLKTRCDLDPRGHACRRCLSLRLDCELPETQDRFQDNASTWSDANAAIPSIEERLVSLERGMGEMIHLMRQMANQSSTVAGSPHSHGTRSVDDVASGDNWPVPSFTLKPVQFIRDLQIECFRDQLSTEADLLGDIVSQGIIDAKLSLKLIELATPEDGRIVAEIKLYRIALKIQYNLQRLRFAEGEYEEIERWKMEWAHLIANEGPSTLELSIWFCQLLLHRTASRLQPESDRLVTEICSNARLIISRSLQTRFSAAPGLIDNVYYILGYAALTLCDYNPSDPQIDQVRAFLLHLAPSSDHLAYRIACIVGEVQRRYSEAASAEQASPSADVLKGSLFVVQPSRSGNLDLTHLMPASGMEPLVEGYGCFEQLIPAGYVPTQPAFSAPAMFQHHPAPVTGGAMPVSLVPRALHDL